MRPITSRLMARQSVLMAHLEMLLEADARGEGMDAAQLDLLASEMEFLVDVLRTLRLMQIERKLPARSPA